MQKSVTLPSHLWRALDDMSKDGAQAAQHLVQLAVEQFVALQGYTVSPRTAVLVPLPRSVTMDEGLEMTLPRAQTGGAPALKPLTLEDEDDGPDDGNARTRLRSATGPPQPAVKEPAAAAAKASAETGVSAAHAVGPIPEMTGEPLLTDTHMALKPIVPVAAPTWSMRSVLSDDASERVAARERLVALEKELAKLTIERPTTTPLSDAAGQAAADDEDSQDDGGDDADPDASDDGDEAE